MNALTTTSTASPIAGFALVPRDMREALSLAEMMAKAGFLARELQNPGGALFVIEQSMRWNMSPFAVAMETSFIQGKPMFSGKIVAAAVQSSGAITGRLSYDYSGSGDDRVVTVRGTVRGETEPREITVKLRDARTNNTLWVKQPDQQLAYFGSRAWARRHTPEVMLGVYAPEEFDETPAEARDVPSVVVDIAPAAPKDPGWPILAPDGSLKEVAPGRWLVAVQKAVGLLESAEAVTAWRREMGSIIASIAEQDDLKAMEAGRIIEARLAAFSTEEQAA